MISRGDKALNIYSLLTGIFIFVSPFLHFISINVQESVFNNKLFMQFALPVIVISTVLAALANIIISRFFLRTAFYRSFPLFYTAFFLVFLAGPARHLLLILNVPAIGRIIISTLFALILVFMIFKFSKAREYHLAALVFALILIAGPMIRMVNSISIPFHRSAFNAVDYSKEWIAQTLKETLKPTNLPNIYFVVPDSYTSVAILQEMFAFDNRPFVQEMEKRGFKHLPDSRSSYAHTSLTFASLLQSDYPVIEASPRYKLQEDFYPSLLYKSQPFSVAKIARHLGYTIVVMGNYTAHCGGPHVYCDANKTTFIPYEVKSFLEMTPFPRLLRKIKASDVLNDADGVDALAHTVKYLSSRERLKSPYFMLIHHLSPHPPYCFESDCRLRSSAEFDFKPNDARSVPLYLDNLQCTNKKLVEFADYIVSVDPTAIVAIQADHGAWFAMQKVSSMPFKDIPDSAIRERISVMSLVRAPDICLLWLRPDLNTVNTVRFLFGCATGREPVYLENKSYMSFYPEDPSYGFVYQVRR